MILLAWSNAISKIFYDSVEEEIVSAGAELEIFELLLLGLLYQV